MLPQAQELWAVFLSGGLLGLMLYRVWTMLLTSLMGTLLAGHAALMLLEGAFSYDAVVWAGANMAALNGVAVGLVILGILLQVVAAPDEAEVDASKVEEPKLHVELEVEHHEPGGHSPGPWWKKLLPARNKAA